MRTLFVILKYAPLAVIGFATVEAAVLAWRRRHYDWRAYLASLADLLVRQHVVYAYLAFGIADPLIGWARVHRIATLPLNTAWGIALLVLGEELAYYAFHRASHRVGLLWASHAVHHTANELNLGASYRFGWTVRFLGTGLFFVPLIWLGFPPYALFVALSLNLLYQFWLHADWIPPLGPLEWVLNTPSHHRVHHAANPDYLDRNYGGVLIVYDRLFGSFAAERDDVPCRYGLVTPLNSNNPVRIAFHGWAKLAGELRRARGLRQWGSILLGPPAEHRLTRRDRTGAAVPAE